MDVSKLKQFVEGVKATDPTRAHVWAEFAYIVSDGQAGTAPAAPIVNEKKKPAAPAGPAAPAARVYSQAEVDAMKQALDAQKEKAVADAVAAAKTPAQG